MDPPPLYLSPVSNPPLLRRGARIQMTGHVAFRWRAGTVGQRLVAVFVVVFFHVHLAAGDQALAVPVTTAAGTLEERREQQNQET